MSDADRMRAWAEIDANINSATKALAVEPAWFLQNTVPIQAAIAHTLMAIAQMARIAMAERYERSGKAP